ncbi:beta-1,3-galactosyltransferase 4-like [Dermacentor variabilis]|uniref:beta-1,3-galactosyltransferase 4-like n=1 Tax=Dermacentor variabilis TaxID=34621 RepID=UPI003F5C4D99
MKGAENEKMTCAESLPVQRFVRRTVASVWFLLAVCVANYALVRYCMSDMRWHDMQRDQTRIVVGPGRFSALPRPGCPDFLAIVVCSAVDHFEQRAAVRDTWARDAAARRSSVFFIIGFDDNTVGALALSPTALGTNNNLRVYILVRLYDHHSTLMAAPAQPSGMILQERVANESARYGDIIQADFRDTYRNLTLKSVFLLKWAFMYCSRAQFLLKTDDDVFVNVDNLVRFLLTLRNGKRRTGQAVLVLSTISSHNTAY